MEKRELEELGPTRRRTRLQARSGSPVEMKNGIVRLLRELFPFFRVVSGLDVDGLELFLVIPGLDVLGLHLFLVIPCLDVCVCHCF